MGCLGLAVTCHRMGGQGLPSFPLSPLALSALAQPVDCAGILSLAVLLPSDFERKTKINAFRWEVEGSMVGMGRWPIT
jgi:hypothetical protein